MNALWTFKGTKKVSKIGYICIFFWGQGLGFCIFRRFFKSLRNTGIEARTWQKAPGLRASLLDSRSVWALLPVTHQTLLAADAFPTQQNSEEPVCIDLGLVRVFSGLGQA